MPNLDPARGQRAGEGGDQRRRARVVNPAGKDEADLLGGNPAVDRLADHARRPVPRGRSWTVGPRARRIRGPRARTGASRRGGTGRASPARDVQVGGDSLALQLRPPGRGGRRRSGRTAGGTRARPPAARPAAPAARSPGCPRPRADPPSCRPASRSSVTDFGFAQQGQGQERQAPALRHRLGKPGDVADAGHRTLKDRDSACRGRRPGPKPPPAAGQPAQRRFPSAIACSTAWTIPPTVTNLRARSLRQGRVLTDGQRTCPSPSRPGRARRPPRPRPPRSAACPQPGQRVRAGQRENPQPGTSRRRDDRGLTPVPAGDPLAPFRAQR